MGLVTLLCGVAVQAGEVPFARDLTLAPDGQTLAFSWAGDIWAVPIAGGTAMRLTVHPANETHPVWSPDGHHIAFASNRFGAGDAFDYSERGGTNIFVMGADGGDVRRLTFADVVETPTSWSPDGEWIYFHSQREGEVYRESRIYRVPATGGQPWRALDCFGSQAAINPGGEQMAFVRGGLPWVRWSRRGYRGSADMDLFVCPLDGSKFTQLTEFNGTDRMPTWDAAGAGLYFLSDRGGTANIWYLPLDTGEPEQVTFMEDDDVREFAVSADGRTLAFTHWDAVYVMATADRAARMIEITAGDDLPENQLAFRTFTSDADEQEPAPDGKEVALVVRGEIYVIKTEEGRPTRQVTDGPARDHHVVWSPDGKALFFVSDRAGQEDIYRAVSAEEPAKPLSESLRFKIERVTDHPALEYAPRVSPDGEKLAFIRSRGDLIIRDLKTGEETTLVESWDRPSYAWSPDSKWLAYAIEDVEHNRDVWVVPADGSAAPVNVSQHPDYDGGPEWSADGQLLAFGSRRHGFDGDLYVVFLSPAFDEMSDVDLDLYFEAQAKAVKKRKPPKSVVASGKIALAGEVPATQPADDEATATQPAETKPGETQPAETQPAEPAPDELTAKVRRIVQEYLEEKEKGKEKKADDAAEDEDQEKAEAEGEPYAYELETAYRRIRRVTNLPGNQLGFALSPTGETLAFVSSHEGDTNLYTIKWDGSERKQIRGDSAGALRWSFDGARLFYLRGGRPVSCRPDGGGAETHAFRARMRIDQRAEAAQKFNDGARQLGMRFYHPTMKGLDWPALTEKYRQLALRTVTIPAFNEVFNMLLGELNASHLGLYGPRTSRGQDVGRLGCSFDRTFPGPGLKVASVLEDSPADRKESRLVPGDVILKVNGQAVGPAAPLEQALLETVDQEVIIELAPSPDRAADDGDDKDDNGDDEKRDEAAGATRELVIRPVSSGRIANLQYEAWVRANRAYVAEKSDGRVGYVHIRGMNEPSFERFERDLYAAAHGREGLIIDVRSNGGGWTADWVLAVLNVRRHAYTIQRGADERGYPQDRLIFYSWTKPATMMCNHQSFSNAEIVSHAFKNLGRGPLVGTTTYGGVISTGGYRLIDGALVRMPERGWYTLPHGVDMEEGGAVPDIEVPVTPEDEVQGRRPQLDAAIKATLTQIKAEKEAWP